MKWFVLFAVTWLTTVAENNQTFQISQNEQSQTVEIVRAVTEGNNVSEALGSQRDVYQSEGIPIKEAGKDVNMEMEMEEYASLRAKLDLYNPQRIAMHIRNNGSVLSGTCRQTMETYLTGLKESQLWALRILDASGSYSSSFMFGNNFWLGSQSACLDLVHHGNANTSPPFQVTFYVAKYLVTLNVSSTQPMHFVNVGICLPDNCSRNEITGLLSGTSTPSAVLKNVRPVPDKSYNFHLEPIGITLLIITVIGMLLVFAGTYCDVYMEKKQQEADFDQAQRNKEIGQNKENAIKNSTVDKLRFYVSHNVEGNRKDHSDIQYTESTTSINSSTSSASVSSFDSTENKIGIGAQVLMCFSFKRNIKKIFSIKATDALSCVHGLRVFSLLWVIAGHTCMITMPFVDNKGFRVIVERDFLFQSISNGAFSVDTFFFISGLLISYIFNKSEREKNTGKEESSTTHVKVSMAKFVGGVTYRIIRLTPPYLVVLVLTYLAGRWFQHNSIFDPPVADMHTCPKYWWRNVLYINTLFPVNQMCMIWSWYLADDTQFYVLGLIILLLSSRYCKSASIFTVLLLVSSWITTAVITLQTQHKPSIEEPLGLFDQLYDKPWTRLGPYIIGMAVGYYLARVNCKATFHKGIVALGWTLSMITTFVLVHGLYGELGQVESAAYVALSHTAWALAISWVVIACVTGYGGPVNKFLSSKLFAPLSRLTYCAYLIHPLIMFSAVAHMDGPAHLQRDTMIMTIFGYFFASYLGSVLLTVVFEAPAVSLLNIFHPLKKKMK